MILRTWNQWFGAWVCSKGCKYEFRDWTVGRNINQKDRLHNEDRGGVSFAWDRKQGEPVPGFLCRYCFSLQSDIVLPDLIPS